MEPHCVRSIAMRDAYTEYLGRRTVSMPKSALPLLSM